MLYIHVGDMYAPEFVLFAVAMEMEMGIGDDRRRRVTMNVDPATSSSYSYSYSSCALSVSELRDVFDDAFVVTDKDDDDTVDTAEPSPRIRCDADVLLDVAWRMAVRTTVTEENASSTVSSVEEIFERVDAVAETLALEALGRRLGGSEDAAPLRLVSPERNDGDEEEHIRRRRDAILDAKDIKELAVESIAFGDFEEARERVLRWHSLCDATAPARAFALLAATTFGTEKVLIAKRRGETIRITSASCIEELDAYTSRKRQRREALRELTTQAADEQPSIQAAASRGRATKSPLGSPSRASTWRDTEMKMSMTTRECRGL